MKKILLVTLTSILLGLGLGAPALAHGVSTSGGAQTMGTGEGNVDFG